MKRAIEVVAVVVCLIAANGVAFRSHQSHRVPVLHRAVSPAQLTLADGGAPPPPWPCNGCPAEAEEGARLPLQASSVMPDGGAPPPPWPCNGCPTAVEERTTIQPQANRVVPDGGAPPPPWPCNGCPEAAVTRTTFALQRLAAKRAVPLIHNPVEIND